MAGHSKWANIRFRKGAQDAKRGKLFTKLIREITVAARMGGGDAASNPRLRAAIDKALSNNMTKDTIERAVKRGAGGEEGADLDEVRYEGYGPGGVAVMVDCLTDNRNRTVAEVRHAFTKMGGNLGTSGSVSYLFEKKGVISFDSDVDEEQLLELALESGAEDVVTDDTGTVEVITEPEQFSAVKQQLEDSALNFDSATVTMRASTQSTVTEKEAASLIKLLDMLEDLDDVQEVYSNADIPDEILQSLVN
ncbi:MAG TPA: YebC/PmpR family DNA-binding transcriptional regulator [Gammaproteobacteria bacterium]|nr:YebC/PmpR family DNA-binding transcriptional regulator [Gammaproteobacteria bacterium]